MRRRLVVLLVLPAAAVAASFLGARHLEARLHARGGAARTCETWLHRAGVARFGHPGSAATLEQLDRAIKAGYRGIELDVRWDPRRGLVVAHDRSEVAEGPALGEALERHGRALSYWLDFKGLDTAVAQSARDPLAHALAAADVAAQTVVEASDRAALALLRPAGARLVAHLGALAAMRPSPAYIMTLAALVDGEIDGVTIAHRRFVPALAAALTPVPTFTYTTDEEQERTRLCALGAAVVLSDRLSPGS